MVQRQQFTNRHKDKHNDKDTYDTLGYSYNLLLAETKTTTKMKMIMNDGRIKKSRTIDNYVATL